MRPRGVPELSLSAGASGCPNGWAPQQPHPGTPASLPAYLEDRWSRAYLGEASTASFFQVGLAWYNVPSQATTDEGVGGPGLRVLSLLLRGGVEQAT